MNRIGIYHAGIECRMDDDFKSLENKLGGADIAQFGVKALPESDYIRPLDVGTIVATGLYHKALPLSGPYGITVLR